MRAAIAFKWAAFGLRRWRWQLAQYAAFALSYLVGSLLLTGSDDTGALHDCAATSTRVVGSAIFAVAVALDLIYLVEEARQAFASRTPLAYFSSLTNFNDLALGVLVLVLALMLAACDERAPQVSAVGALLLFLKGAEARPQHMPQTPRSRPPDSVITGDARRRADGLPRHAARRDHS